MPTLLKQDLSQVSYTGEISQISPLLLDEYQTIGYSLTLEDIELILVQDFTFYAGWAITQVQRSSDQFINSKTMISIGEWGIIEPVIRAHIDFMHAQRMEGSSALGGERFGLDTSTARQNYEIAKQEMKGNAFVEPVFTLDYDYIKP